MVKLIKIKILWLKHQISVISEYISDNPFMLLERLIIGLLPFLVSKSVNEKS